ncbi:hypothetical protein [Acrocarpospora catenulata]|uniref:hypothetical protein n=1 Tax=Acrocarpospora catenulata TaxID=2836182 RepID=UPI001BDAC237|nr:hypothetical protein [Acrocarpospora catenulata]
MTERGSDQAGAERTATSAGLAFLRNMQPERPKTGFRGMRPSPAPQPEPGDGSANVATQEPGNGPAATAVPEFGDGSADPATQVAGDGSAVPESGVPVASPAPAPREAYENAGGEPASGPGRTSGGDRVAAAVARLEGLAERPVGEHVGVYEEVLGELESTLASVDERT